MLHLRLGDLCTRAWFAVAPRPAVNMPLSTAFLESFIRGIFLSERKVLPYRLLLVAILANPKPGYNVNSNQDTQGNPNNTVERSEETLFVRVASQIVLKPRTPHRITVTWNACRIELIEPRTVPTSRQSTLAAWGIVKILPIQPIHTFVNNFSDRVLLPKQTKIAQSAKPPSIIHVIDTDNREASPIGTPVANTNLNFNAPDGSVNKQASRPSEMSAAQYIAAETQDFLKGSRRTAIIEASLQDVQDWKEEVRLSDKYSK